MATSEGVVAEYLHVMQLSDSFFPAGLFATSGGLESIFLQKEITTMQGLLGFCKVLISQQVGPCEGVVAANAYSHAKQAKHDAIADLDSMYCAMRTNKESRQASTRSGSQVVRCVMEFLEGDHPTINWYSKSLGTKKVSGVYPVALGLCCSAMQTSKSGALSILLYGTVVSCVGAALRMGIIHHFEGQKIIHNLKPQISKTISEVQDKNASEAWQFTPQLDIFQMHHEALETKMFVT